jgi:hypothetical protein
MCKKIGVDHTRNAERRFHHQHRQQQLPRAALGRRPTMRALRNTRVVDDDQEHQRPCATSIETDRLTTTITTFETVAYNRQQSDDESQDDQRLLNGRFTPKAGKTAASRCPSAPS